MIHYTLSNTRLLPIEYLEVAYLESTGTLYIDTEYIPTSLTTFSLKALCTKNNSMLMGTVSTNSGTHDQFSLYINNNVVRVMKGSSANYTITINNIASELLDVNLSETSLTINGNSINFEANVTQVFPNLHLFKTTGGGGYYTNGKLYSFILWESGVLKRHFVPCYRKSDNKPGLFDIVEKKFYINSGSGEFILGNEIRPIPEEYLLVEWIGNEKAQGYINIAYTHVANTWVDTELSFDSLYDYNTMFGACTTDNGSDSFTFGARNNGIINANLGSGYQTNSVLFTAGTFSKLKISPATIIKDSTTISPNKSTTACDKPWALFTRRNGTSYTNESGHGRIKYMKIYEGTFNNTSATLKRDLVPCYRKKDNVSGVYDLVTKTFYASTIPLKTGYPINQIYEMDVTGGGGLILYDTSEYSKVRGSNNWVDIKTYDNIIKAYPNLEYTLIFDAKSSVSGQKISSFLWNNDSGIVLLIGTADGNTLYTLTTSYLRFTKHYTFLSSGNPAFKRLLFRNQTSDATATIYVKNIKLYIGNISSESSNIILNNVGQSYGIEGQYDKNIYTESDGSKWIRIFHHNNPANARFESTDTFTTGVYKDANRWFDVAKCNEVDKWELMIKEKPTSDAVTSTYRFILYVNPISATSWNLVKPGTVKNISGGTYGGIWRINNNAYLVTANNASDNWFGAIGAWNSHQGGIPGYPNTVITSGFMDLYLRVDNVCPMYKDCYLFNETGYCEIPSGVFKCFDNDVFTISFWIKDEDANRSIYFGNYSAAPNFNIEKKADGNLRYYQVRNDGTKDIALFAIPKSKWTLVTLTVNSGTLKAYKNGTLSSTTSIGTKSSSSYANTIFRIGSDTRSDNTRFKGYMLDFRVYDYALTDNEILKLYNMRNV